MPAFILLVARHGRCGPRPHGLLIDAGSGTWRRARRRCGVSEGIGCFRAASDPFAGDRLMASAAVSPNAATVKRSSAGCPTGLEPGLRIVANAIVRRRTVLRIDAIVRASRHGLSRLVGVGTGDDV
jgi:hypothetical protein